MGGLAPLISDNGRTTAFTVACQAPAIGWQREQGTPLVLPDVNNDAELDAFMADAAAVRRVLDELGIHLGVAGSLTAPERGSAIVGLGETVVLKVMAPHDGVHADTEQVCLRTLHGRLPVPTPELLETGEIDGWRWTLMRRLPGHELVDVWPTLDDACRLRLASELGELLTTLHDVEAPSSIERVDWSAWVAARWESLTEAQRSKGCPEELLVGLDDLVATADLSPGRAGWLHTEVMLEHLLVDQTQDGWQLSGLFDFEPSWVGPVDYEFASVGLFFSLGDGVVLDQVLRAAGRDATPERLFAMAMMHRYANLGWYHARLGGPMEVERLASHWFGR